MIQNLILKEEIENYHILPAEEDRTEDWLQHLNYAVRLGNEHKSKTFITFNTSEGPKSVETTVWSLTEHYISLKGGYSYSLEQYYSSSFLKR